MIRQKQRRFNRFGIFILAATAMASSLVPARPASAADCTDVFTPLSSFVVNGVNANKGWYQRVMNETGVPWEMLAAIHFREVNFSHSNPSNGQGIFQFVNGDGGPYPPGPVSDEEFYRQLKYMATRLQNDYVWRGSVPRERRNLQPNEQNMAIVKDTLYSYNGRAGAYANQAATYGYNSTLQPYEGSPYVMNRFDCQRARMGIITQSSGSLNGTDTRYGTFTIFSRLRGDDYWKDLTYQLVIADNGDPRQYVMYRNIKQEIPTPEIKTAWGLQNVSLTTVPGSQIANTPSGPSLDILYRINGSNTVYMADRGKRYMVASPDMITAWGLNSRVISDVSLGLGFTPDDGGPLSYSVRKTGTLAIYMIDGVNGAGQPVIRQYPTTELLMAIEGTTPQVTEVSAGLFDNLDNAVGNQLLSTKAAYGGQEYQMIAGQRMEQPYSVAVLYPGVAAPISQITFNRLAQTARATALIRSATSPHVYLLDNGVRRRISDPDMLNAWIPLGQHVNIVNDGFVNLMSESSAVSSYIAAGSSNFVIAGGSKVVIPGNLAQAYTGNLKGTQPLSSSLEALYPVMSTASAFIKSDKSPKMYFLDNSGKLRGLSTPADAQAWGSTNTHLTVLHAAIVNSFGLDSEAKLFVSDGSTEYVLNNGQKLTLNSETKTNWGLDGKSPQVFGDGTLSSMASGGQLASKAKDAQGFYLIREGKAFYTVDSNIAKLWNIQDASANYTPAITSLTPLQMLTRFVVTPDGTTYAVDNGQWLMLSDTH
ncbi:MAG TPA: hypothetical protein VFO38_02590, partial [Candidatus Saccharimonadales bacterium]|nr:hypothetical protein [Candidatus Saccharimonadales bacterium]